MAVDPQEWLRNKRQGTSTSDIDPQEWLQNKKLELESGNKELQAQSVDFADPSWGEVLKSAASNSPKSLAGVAKGIGETILHPIDAAKGMLDVVAGGLQNALPESINKAIASIDPGAENAAAAREKASQFGEFYKNRYGSEAGFKEAVANDPASVLMDLSTLVSGTGAAKLARNIDPALWSLKGAKKAAEVVGNTAANVVGGIGTHTGGESIKAATRAGLQGGQKEADFIANMRGATSADEILPELKQALQNMRAQRGAAYLQGMAEVGQNPTVIPMTNIENAINGALNIKNYKGQSLSPTTAGVQEEILKHFDNWKNLDPAEFHTAEGLDAFKQIIGDIRQNTQPGTPQRTVASSVYDAVKSEINKNDPNYAKVMKDYEQASKLTNEIEKSLSLGEKSTADTALRKLQSLTRNNVSTNYGNRIKLAKELESAGGADFMDKLQAQALSSWQPRGLGGIVSGSTGAFGLYAHDPSVIPIMALQSPRLVGEAALKVGQGARLAGQGANAVKDAALNMGINPDDLAKIIYQAREKR